MATTVAAPEPLHKAPERPKTVDELIVEKSAYYGVSEALVRQIIRCESGFRPNAVGDGGYSFGLVQIHLPSHPVVTQEQALDPEFAITFLTKNLSGGRGDMWTCYRLLMGS